MKADDNIRVSFSQDVRSWRLVEKKSKEEYLMTENRGIKHLCIIG
jgi:hypothetical protein